VLAPLASGYTAYRREHDLIDADVADEGFCAKQVVLVDRDTNRQSLDVFGRLSHLATMVLRGAITAVFG